jgi:hypothetical protein
MSPRPAQAETRRIRRAEVRHVQLDRAVESARLALDAPLVARAGKARVIGRPGDPHPTASAVMICGSAYGVPERRRQSLSVGAGPHPTGSPDPEHAHHQWSVVESMRG